MAAVDYMASLKEIRFQVMIRIPSALYWNFEHIVMNCEVIFAGTVCV
jgi:hypothetical protein